MTSNSLENYALSEFDCSLLDAAKDLLTKLTHADMLRYAQLVTVAKLLHALARTPRTTEALDLEVGVTSPRRKFGEIETYHWWTLKVEGNRLGISGGGHFYRPSSGGDSFSTMMWAAEPGEPAEFVDYIDGLGIVPDVKSFPDAVRAIDFSTVGYSIEVTDSDNVLLEDEDEDEDEDEEEEEEGERPFLELMPVDTAGQNLAACVDVSDVNRRKPDYACGIDSCDLCRCDLKKLGMFVDGSLRSQLDWANMCPRCFEKSGTGIGWGKGQLYALQRDGLWRLVSGFDPN